MDVSELLLEGATAQYRSRAVHCRYLGDVMRSYTTRQIYPVVIVVVVVAAAG